ncbi:MAG: HNH endonuclease [Flavobacterium sp.]|nr:MAG: HNH endonuclease [Flavobacterium sp.]
MVLLEKSLNQKADILPFNEKKKIFAKSNSKLTQNFDSEYETWSESKIVSRQKILARFAKSVWKIQF